MIVGAGERHDRIDKTSFLQAEENGIRAELGAKTTVAELVVGLAGIFLAVGIAEFGFLAAAALENAEDVAGLGDFPAIERIELGENAFRAGFFRRGRRRSLDGLRQASRP